MAEQVARLNEEGVQVYNDRLVVYGTTHRFADDTVPEVAHGRRTWTAAIVLFVLGLACLASSIPLASGPALAIGILLMVAGFIARRFQNVQHSLLLRQSDTVKEVLKSGDLDLLLRVEEAVRLALIR